MLKILKIIPLLLQIMAFGVVYGLLAIAHFITVIFGLKSSNAQIKEAEGESHA
ncbi:hypothetical protein [Vibrio superstes]|uniref:hypothetical protein n=1 Tax=Vibrio superstes TaxID=198815 RepID=UPI0013C2EEE2|nr:hypothetical protein [Vibrio superstes]